MKLTIPDVQDAELRQVILSLQSVLSNLSSDNMKVEEIEGITSSIAGGPTILRHGLKAKPKLWFPLEGDVYIPRHGINEINFDIRSRNSSEEFRILLVF